jgi:Uma2 family endonuclease
MATAGPPRATIDDLYKIDGKAELINGRIVHFMPTGRLPNRAAGKIYRRLADFAEQAGVGEAYSDGIGFTVPELPSGRESFGPNAAYYVGPLPANGMRFIEGPPTFAVVVRSENDYGPAAEREMAAKRADYFQAGTLVVWDVDPKAETVTCYRHDRPGQPVVFRRGQTADAEPAAPGWRIAVDDVFA